jgi:phosphatidylethanolamine/phosphatidyl-N-methylethanolamine N-methyltransferase
MQTPFNFAAMFDKLSESLYSGNSGYLINQTHKQLTNFGNKKAKNKKTEYKRILEIGAGKGELYQYVKGDFAEYLMTDISSWGENEINKITKADKRIKFELQNIENLTYPDNHFDRILVTCVVAHVDEPFKALEELRRVASPDGVLSIAVSTDPSIFLRIIRKLLVLRKMRNSEIPYDLHIAIQHRNNPLAILTMVKWIFEKDEIQIKYYPFRIKSWNLSTHLIINIVKK